MKSLSVAARTWIAFVLACAVTALAYGILHWTSPAPLRFAALTVLALVTSRMRVKLPGLTGVMAMNLPFLLMLVAEAGFSASLLVALLCGVVQSFSSASKPKPVQLMFNAATLLNAIAIASLLAALGYYLANTVPVTIVLWLAEGRKPLPTWARMAELSVPCYLLSAAVAAVTCCGLKGAVWSAPLGLLAAMFLTWRSYSAYFSLNMLKAKSATSSTA